MESMDRGLMRERFYQATPCTERPPTVVPPVTERCLPSTLMAQNLERFIPLAVLKELLHTGDWFCPVTPCLGRHRRGAVGATALCSQSTLMAPALKSCTNLLRSLSNSAPMPTEPILPVSWFWQERLYTARPRTAVRTAWEHCSPLQPMDCCLLTCIVSGVSPQLFLRADWFCRAILSMEQQRFMALATKERYFPLKQTAQAF